MFVCHGLVALAAAIFLGATLTHHAQPTLIYSVLVLLGIARAFGGPAGQSLGATLVKKEELTKAIAFSSSAWQAAMIAGPTIGGLLIAVGHGPTVAYGSAFVLLLVSLVLIAGIPRVVRADEPKKERGLKTLFAGITYVRNNKVILGAVSLDLFAVLLGGATALLPFFAGELGVGSLGYGVLRSAPGVGAVAVAALVGRYPITRAAGKKMFACVFLFGAATIAFGWSRWFALSVVALFITGAADMISVVVRQTLVQVLTPDAMRGRVSAVSQVFIGASNELGEFESGLTATWFGSRLATILGGVGTCLVVVTWAALFPKLYAADKLDGT